MSTYDDVTEWPLNTAAALCIGLDLALHADYSFMTVGGVWLHNGRSTIGVVDMKQFHLGCPLEEVADYAVATANNLPNSKLQICFDGSNNSAFSGILAQRFGVKSPNHLISCPITNAAEHANQPQLMQISLHGQRAAIRRWPTSKKALVEELAAEIAAQTILFGKVGDWEIMNDELSTLARQVSEKSNFVTYAAQPGKHDDAPMSAALCLFGLRYASGLIRQRRVTRPRAPRFDQRAWT